MTSSAIVLDVRTPEEYAEGHLEGSVLLDWNSGDFVEGFTKLDPASKYLLYCRSGARSGRAADLLKENGFGDVTNLGTLEEAAGATGIRIITD